MQRIAWLFLRGTESIRVERRPDTCALEIFGPGPAHEAREFGDEDELIAFQGAYEQRLLDEGWILQAYEDRRSGADRRSAQRGSTDRRRRLPAE